MFRYVGIIWTPSDPAGEANATRWTQRLTQSAPGWAIAFQSPGLRVLCRAGRTSTTFAPHLLAQNSGVVLGVVFHRRPNSTEVASPHGPRFTNEETERITSTGAHTITELYWGRYVAFITSADEQTTWVVKDPTGRLPCFVAHCERATLVFSYMPDCVATGALRFNINWAYIAARVALGCGRPDDTGIENIAELCGGECLEVRKGRTSRRLHWNPQRFFSEPIIEDPAVIAPLLRDTVRSCTQVWAAKHETLIHQLSGGLDSSIVLPCLAEAPSRPRVICLTYFRQGGVSDERPWARLAARRSGCEHIEHARSPQMDFAALSSMNVSASPPLTHSFLEIDSFEQSIADQYHATAISSGDGGDSLFGSTSAHFSVLDFVRRRGIRPSLLRIASDAALLGNQSVWTILSKSLRIGLLHHDPQETIHLRDARKLVTPEVRDPLLTVRSSMSHPWFRSTQFAPGAEEIASFLTLPDLFYPPLNDPDAGGIEKLCPLLSQPIVELCLSIPSYLHFDQGRDRGLARRAFALDVPAPILDRTWKDRVQGFPEEILLANLPYFRELLLDGQLVKERYLDRVAIESTLSGKALKDTASVGEVIDHVLVESWLQSWASRNDAANPVVARSTCSP